MKQQRLCGASQLVTKGVSDGHLNTMAGNAMNIPSIGAFVLAMILCLQPAHNWPAKMIDMLSHLSLIQ